MISHNDQRPPLRECSSMEAAEMKYHDTFENLLRLNGRLRKEEVFVLFFHSCILDSNFVYKLSKEREEALLANDKVKIEDGYIKYMTDNNNDAFIISRLLLDPEWKRNSSNYNFMYRNAQNSETYNLNILKIENSLVLHIINTAKPSVVHSVTINMNEYVSACEEETMSDSIEKNMDKEKLKSIFQTHILNNMHVHINKHNHSYSIRNEVTRGSNIPERDMQGNARRENPSPFFQHFSDDHFDDKNPAIGRNLIPNMSKDDNVLRPDGLLVGPNNKFFNPKHLRYDPIGPFGNEPNSDNKPFEFNNNFPF
ncbi:hypothetical protein, conserved [Plasmodium ovale curtisi]|uniref:PI31 proteasome regulator N-terminal domain-containing protein n=2 Tax=Plasmodium ovale TaxID=36330 RepID=A0A1A8VQL6_PLAOA|nr:hypothetical protein, conserved [Plasmodium ovale curtisi]SBS87707.1 hypothetical protein, conserved [Plasmodium ovale curtisi]